MNCDSQITVEVMYHHVDRIGMGPQVNERFPCDEAPGGSLLEFERTPLIRVGRRVGWINKGLR